jgi:hypothetical protein
MRNSVITVAELQNANVVHFFPFKYQWQQQSEIERLNCLWVGGITVDLPIIQSKVYLHLYPVFRWICG